MTTRKTLFILYFVLGTTTIYSLHSPFRTTSTALRCAIETSPNSSFPCKGHNTTHVAWISMPSNDKATSISSASHQLQLRRDAEKEALAYLRTNLMPFDVPNAETLGFQRTELPDGLSNGIVHPTISLALEAKSYSWTNNVPKDIYFEYVVNFANVNEGRSNWRPLFHSKLEPLVQKLLNEEASVEQVVYSVNRNLWTLFDSVSGKPIVFKSGQTPLIYDPMSVITFGYASCTGVSILLVNALRAVGIPARLAGTDAWNGNPENGNHSWIEFYGSDQKWHIMESLPASGDNDNTDLLDPCQWWFCTEDRVKDTNFYAARLDRVDADGQYFPMSWDLDNHGVPGEDRTNFMRELCSKC